MPERDGKAPRGLPIVGLTAGSRTGLHRETIRRAITSDEPPKYSRAGRVEARWVKAQIARLRREDPDLAGFGIGELCS